MVDDLGPASTGGAGTSEDIENYELSAMSQMLYDLSQILDVMAKQHINGL